MQVQLNTAEPRACSRDTKKHSMNFHPWFAISSAEDSVDGGVLPPWLNFDPAAGTLSGVPPLGAEVDVQAELRENMGIWIWAG